LSEKSTEKGALEGPEGGSRKSLFKPSKALKYTIDKQAPIPSNAELRGVKGKKQA